MVVGDTEQFMGVVNQSETFEQLLLTCSYELFGPSKGLGFAHRSGPLASPRRVPQKAHNGRSNEFFKALQWVREVKIFLRPFRVLFSLNRRVLDETFAHASVIKRLPFTFDIPLPNIE